MSVFRYHPQVSHECAAHALNNLRAAAWVTCAQLDMVWEDPRIDTMQIGGLRMAQLRPDVVQAPDVGYTLETVNLALRFRLEFGIYNCLSDLILDAQEN